MYGRKDERLLPSWVVRLNPHNNESMQVQLIDRVRTWIQVNRQVLTQLLPETVPRIRAVYLFYGAGSAHKNAAELAIETFTIDTAFAVKDLDDDIAEFTFADLHIEDEFIITAEMTEELAGVQSSSLRCQGINHANNAAKKRRCSATALKNFGVCRRHLNKELVNEHLKSQQENESKE
jgi:hypothetical protein